MAPPYPRLRQACVLGAKAYLTSGTRNKKKLGSRPETFFSLHFSQFLQTHAFDRLPHSNNKNFLKSGLNLKVCERMSFEESKIIVYLCRYSP